MNFSDIKGFGEKRIAALKSAGINTPADLITYFPSRYIDTKRLSDLSTAVEGERVSVLARTLQTPKAAYIRKGLSVVKVKFVYGDKTVWCSWFNLPYMARNIIPERYYYIFGCLKKFKNSFEITSPQLIRFTGEEPPVIPVYKSIGKVNSQLIAEAVKIALKAVTAESYVPQRTAEKYGLCSLDKAFRSVHFPCDVSEAAEAQRVLSIERLTYMLGAYSVIKEREGNKRVIFYNDNRDKLNAAAESLPYKLTSSQKKCLNSIVDGLHSRNRLNTLLEGDVGCGKTIVAFLAMYYAALSGCQSVLMAPTEILAYQHYVKAIDFLEKYGVRCEYVSGSLSKKTRENALFNIAAGNACCIFGTHALLNDDVNFNRLSLVITDEQHRFGVAQRASLENKAKGADSIVMSATPIPRTLALTLYGDLDILTINALPDGRAQVATRFVPPEKEEGMWNYILSRALIGEQAYVVVPRIYDDDDGKTGAETIYEKYKEKFGDKIALLHGRQKDSVKNAVMRAFAEGKISVLVATTVVEVGVDVQSATTMAIYDADRFGLAQLHQLRGRVGRGAKDSFCFVLSSSGNEDSRLRLERFIGCSDGFALAEYDFAARGAGDFLGYSQHGTGGGFPSDPEIVATAKALKDEIMNDATARKKIEASIGENKYEFFSKLTLN